MSVVVSGHMKKFLTPHIVQDLKIIMLSIFVAVIIIKTGMLSHFIKQLGSYNIIGAFIAGMFFTSVFTTAPALATLGELGVIHNPFVIAFIGGIGAVIGDMIIFRFIRDRFSEDIREVFRLTKPSDRLKKLAELQFFRWFILFFGGFIIASPLPDEIGISLLGMAKISTRWFVPISFVFNSIGILVVILTLKKLL